MNIISSFAILKTNEADMTIFNRTADAIFLFQTWLKHTFSLYDR